MGFSAQVFFTIPIYYISERVKKGLKKCEIFKWGGHGQRMVEHKNSRGNPVKNNSSKKSVAIAEML